MMDSDAKLQSELLKQKTCKRLKNRKNHYEKHIEENSSAMVGSWKKLSFPMMDAAKFITGD